MSFNSNGVNLKGQFNLKNTDPIDGRYIITSTDEYEKMTTKLSSDSAVYLYPGLMFTVTTELILSNKTNFVVPNVYKTNADGKKVVVPGAYQVAADGLTVNKVPKFTMSPTIPDDDTPGVIGDIVVVFNA